MSWTATGIATRVVPSTQSYEHGTDLEAHDVVATVYVEGFAGYGAGEVAGEKEGYAADFELVYVAVKRGALGGSLEHVAHGADAAGSESLDGTGGDGVDADVAVPRFHAR